MSDSRYQQIEWLKSQVDTILGADQSSGKATARDLVIFWEKGKDLPSWYDNHDRRLLIDYVAQAMGT